ncbi:hypothetical protein HDU98_005504, partial [Podochytrium sp. JEL0797]
MLELALENAFSDLLPLHALLLPIVRLMPLFAPRWVLIREKTCGSGAVGEKCSTGAALKDCLSGVCTAGADPAFGTCAQAGKDGACGSDPDCLSNSCVNKVCKPSLNGGLCKTPDDCANSGITGANCIGIDAGVGHCSNQCDSNAQCPPTLPVCNNGAASAYGICIAAPATTSAAAPATTSAAAPATTSAATSAATSGATSAATNGATTQPILIVVTSTAAATGAASSPAGTGATTSAAGTPAATTKAATTGAAPATSAAVPATTAAAGGS